MDYRVLRSALRSREPLVAAGMSALLGLGIAEVGPGSPVILAPAIAVWAIVVIGRIGTRPVVTGAMMGVAFTAPMNGLRVRVLAATDVMLAIAFLGLALEMLATRRRLPALPVGFWAGTALVVGGGLLGTVFADSPRGSLAHLVPFTVAATLPVIAFQMWGPSLAILRKYAWCWASGAAVSGAVGLFSSGGITGRPGGLTPHPNHLAMTCALGAAIALTLWLSEVGWRRQGALALFGLLVLTVVRAGSRAGLVALLVGAAIVIVRTRELRSTPERIGRGALALLALALLAGALIGTGVVHVGRQNAVFRLFGDTSAQASDAERLSALDENVRRISSRPLTGSGFEKALQAHNIYLQILAAAGIAGLVGFLMLVASVVREGLQAGAGPPDDLLLYIRTAFLAGYAGYLVAGLAQNILWDRYVWLHVAVILWARSAVSADSTAAACA